MFSQVVWPHGGVFNLCSMQGSLPVLMICKCANLTKNLFFFKENGQYSSQKELDLTVFLTESAASSWTARTAPVDESLQAK